MTATADGAAMSAAGAVELRPAVAADEPFLFRVYAGTRVEEMEIVPWDAAVKDAFLGMQFAAQRRSYAAQFPKAEQALVLCDGAPVGQCSVDRSGEAVLLVDVALLPERRNTGIGTAVLTRLQGEAASAGKPLGLHVLAGNRAIRLYARLGFATAARSGLHLAMVWRPGPVTVAHSCPPDVGRGHGKERGNLGTISR
jgi:GNAT superfamily N-acetyltransferase